MAYDRKPKRRSVAQHRDVQATARKRNGFLARAALVVALVGVVSVGGTFAWLTASTSAVENSFVPVATTTDIVEDNEGSVKRDVVVSNGGDIPVYVRAMVVVSWEDGEGNVVANVPDGYSADIMYADLTSSAAAWFEGSDGLYYCKAPVNPGSSTDPLIEEGKAVVPQGGQEYYLRIEVLSEAIQAEPADAAEEAWRAIDVDANGKLKPAAQAS